MTSNPKYKKKGGNKMELCYEGALVMPSSYMVMDEDEMSYTEGGLQVSTWIVGTAIDVGLSALGVWNVSAIGWLMGKGLAKLCSGITAKVGSKVIGAVLQNKVLQTALGQYITSKIGIVGTVLGMTSLGGMIATTWDAWDKKLDGYVTI